MDPITKESRGFAFVNYFNDDDARNALNNLNGKDFNGKPLKVEFSKRNSGYKPTPGVYLGTAKRRY